MKLLELFGLSRAQARVFSALGLMLVHPLLRADIVFEWNDALAASLAMSADLPPHGQVRIYALAHLAMEEAITAARQLPASDRPAGARLAASSAAHAVLSELIPAAAGLIDGVHASHAAGVTDGGKVAHARRIGHDAAARVLSRRQNDGWSGLTLFHPGTGPLPNPTPQAAAALASGADAPKSPWLSAMPFVLRTAAQVSATPPYTVSRQGTVIASNLPHSTLFHRVERSSLAEGRDHWTAEKPFARWNRIARIAGERRGLDLAGEARLLVVLNLALADATLSAQHWRYVLGSWSVMTVEQWVGTDGVAPLSTDVAVQVDDNPYQQFFRLESGRMMLPPVVNFPSPIAVIAGAAQAAIAGYFKKDDVALAVSLPVSARDGNVPPATPRSFASVAAAARECAFVASLDGHTTREACVSGYNLGAEIGRHVVKRAPVPR